VFVSQSHFGLRLIFVEEARSLPLEWSPIYGRLALPEIIALVHFFLPNFEQICSKNLDSLNILFGNYQWKRISRKQSTRWKHLSWLKAGAFFSLQKNSC
jgi:hypothetical protein